MHQYKPVVAWHGATTVTSAGSSWVAMTDAHGNTLRFRSNEALAALERILAGCAEQIINHRWHTDVSFEQAERLGEETVTGSYGKKYDSATLFLFCTSLVTGPVHAVEAAHVRDLLAWVRHILGHPDPDLCPEERDDHLCLLDFHRQGDDSIALQYETGLETATTPLLMSHMQAREVLASLSEAVRSGQRRGAQHSHSGRNGNIKLLFEHNGMFELIVNGGGTGGGYYLHRSSLTRLAVRLSHVLDTDPQTARSGS